MGTNRIRKSEQLARMAALAYEIAKHEGRKGRLSNATEWFKAAKFAARLSVKAERPAQSI